jgi:hypothetical protein
MDPAHLHGHHHAVQIKQVLHSALALPLIGLMATLCWTTPITGFFYIACAQFLPFPEGMR